MKNYYVDSLLMTATVGAVDHMYRIGIPSPVAPAPGLGEIEVYAFGYGPIQAIPQRTVLVQYIDVDAADGGTNLLGVDAGRMSQSYPAPSNTYPLRTRDLGGVTPLVPAQPLYDSLTRINFGIVEPIGYTFDTPVKLQAGTGLAFDAVGANVVPLAYYFLCFWGLEVVA